MFSEDLTDRARAVLARCQERGLRVVSAESCTGGLISGCLTAVPGASEVVERGLVTYTNAAKIELLGVPEHLFGDHGAVSEEVARAMAAGGLAASPAELCIAVTGIAGPGGGTPAKPVGLVHLVAARRGGAVLHRAPVFDGNRDSVRAQTVALSLDLLLELAGRG